MARTGRRRRSEQQDQRRLRAAQLRAAGSPGPVLGHDGVQLSEELPSQVAFQAAADLAAALAFRGSSLHVVLCPAVAGKSDPDDGVQRPVQLPIALPVQPVPGGVAAGGLQRGGAGEVGERGFAADPAPVRIGRDELSAGDRADSADALQPGSELLNVIGEDLPVQIELRRSARAPKSRAGGLPAGSWSSGRLRQDDAAGRRSRGSVRR